MIDPHDWRTWPRNGNRIDAPEDSPIEQRWAAMWALTCEAYGIDPDNPPPMRKDVVRIGRLRDQ
jgi:hypothetical protein